MVDPTNIKTSCIWENYDKKDDILYGDSNDSLDDINIDALSVLSDDDFDSCPRYLNITESDECTSSKDIFDESCYNGSNSDELMPYDHSMRFFNTIDQPPDNIVNYNTRKNLSPQRGYGNDLRWNNMTKKHWRRSNVSSISIQDTYKYWKQFDKPRDAEHIHTEFKQTEFKQTEYTQAEYTQAEFKDNLVPDQLAIYHPVYLDLKTILETNDIEKCPIIDAIEYPNNVFCDDIFDMSGNISIEKLLILHNNEFIKSKLKQQLHSNHMICTDLIVHPAVAELA